MIITPELKDEFLKYLVNTYELGEWNSISQYNALEDYADGIVGALMKQFSELGLIECKMSTFDFNFTININAHDFIRRGELTGEEILFQDKIEKLYYDLEKLQEKNPKGISLEIMANIGGIIQTIASLYQLKG
ncbi:hypothetical protein [Salmonirosea aquatica]|uniref:DUF2513 domain-containing protein n=1 Tax=Salmonirosea aquatica TaxID=2654236 RepID=A0A7C9FAI5_9BACT|nr:hypothetical protein [Cytophagaceae bacterium SJW1-29]